MVDGDVARNLRLVIGPDSVGGLLECSSDSCIDPIECGDHLGAADRQRFERDSIEALGELANGLVAPVANRRDDFANGLDRPARGGLGAGQELGERGGGCTQVDAAKHHYTLPVRLLRSGGFGAHCGMDSDAAELSSLTTVVADAALRIAQLAERRATDPDDPVIGRLHEIERQLTTAERRLRDVSRALD